MASLLTEQRNPHSMNIDILPTREILEIIHQEDYNACRAVDSQLGQIEQAVEHVVEAFRRGGRLIYVGAGTSGRLGVLDASECPPTFGVDPEMVQGIIAGGWTALRRSVEKAEDFPENGAAEIRERNVCANDVVAGIASSSTTPFVVGALKEAHQRQAKTVFITCNPGQDAVPEADVTICLEVGAEVITGSTRLKAGTATKLVLNMITTTAMIRIGKVFQNLMVDLNATCNKLEIRSRRILHLVTGISYEEADVLIQQAHGRLKTALVMHFCDCSREAAEELIKQHNGRIQDIIPRDRIRSEI
ncbi:MAG: N-acetylmuramic acid 6-phosphate etherase [Candidatus Omnitrophota bacterium]|nr:MAG: N-acetylmuramic acid 6-phosphate etherase [Candidatus Omnitrophota bacterium]